MALQNRETLKNFFGKNKMPSEGAFADLIDSSVNKFEDGFAKDEQYGLMLAPEVKSKTVLSLYNSLTDDIPSWSITLGKDQQKNGLILEKPGKPAALFLQEDGKVGIATVQPQSELEVNGMIGSKGRTGTFARGEVPGDSNWQDLLINQDGCQAFEIMAGIGKKDFGKYALLHATVLCTFGKSHKKIIKAQAHYGWCWNKLKIRVTGDTHDYGIQIRTRCNYGEQCNIRYHITKLWDDPWMGWSPPDK